MTSKQRNIVIPLLIVAACAIVYAQTYAFDFINIDDRAYVWENPAVISGLNSRSIAWAFTSFHSANWHPLTWLSHMLDVELFGGWAGGHHLTSALIHTINSLLAFFVFDRMTGSAWKSAFVALLFAVHPAHVESVAWVAERKDVLSTMFWLLTMLAYLWYTERKEGSGMLRLAIVSGIFALGLMAKPMLVTLPFALLLCDYWPLARLKHTADLRPLVIEKLPLFALAAISSVITFIAQSSAGATVSIAALPLQERIANAVLAYGRYLWMLVYPVNLGFWYPRDPVVNPLWLIAAGACLLAVTVFAWRKRKAYPYLLFGWLWFLGTLVPVIGLVQVGMQSHADRYTYIPYFGLFVMIAWGGAAVAKEIKIPARAVVVAAAILVTACTALGWRQTSLWRDSETLYSHTMSITSDNHFLMSNLCLYYLRRTDAATAERRCTELLEPIPPSVDSFEILGYLRLETGKVDDAVNLFREGLRLDPGSAALHARLAEALARKGETAESERSLQRALELNNGRVSADVMARASAAVANGYLKIGRRDKAVEYLRKALEFRPNDAESRAALDRKSTRLNSSH